MTYASTVLADSPLGWWPADDPTGTTATDDSGNSRNGSYNGSYSLAAAALAPGLGPSVDFTTVNDYINVPNGAWMTVTSWSAEMWFRLDTLPGTGGARGTLFSIRENTNANSSIQIQILNNQIDAFFFYNTGGNSREVIATAVTLTAATTYHLVVTATPTLLTVYLNGASIGSLSYVTSNLNPPTRPLRIGNDERADRAGIDGKVSNAAFYGTALSGARVSAHYAAGLAANIGGGTSHETETAHHGSLKFGGHTAHETEHADTGTITEGFTVHGGTSQEVEQAHAGATGIEVAGGTAAELEQAQAGTVVEGVVVVGGTAQETEQAQTGVITQASGTANNYDTGRVRTGAGVPLWEPGIVPAPLPTSVHVNDIVAAAWDSYSIVNTQLALTDRVEVRRPAYRYRILVANRDLTYWRGHVTPAPQMQLVEPLLYGPATLELPQVQVPYEQPGYGNIVWMVPNAPVRIILVDENNDLVVTVWKGRLLSPKISGARLSWSMMGEATGPAALQDKQIPLSKRRNDLGFWWWGAINQMRLPFLPRLGPDTGIKLWNTGGSSLLNYMLDLAAKGWERNGNQWTCMPDLHEVGGAYRVARKDRTTIHATVYLDDHMAVPDLDRDPAEEPNRMFPSSVSPGGRRIRFGVYPELSDGPPPPFPGHMENGDTGEGVRALISRLIITDYLDLEDKPGGYDNDVEDAVRSLQRKAGLAVTGEVNNATWLALFDVGITGYDAAGSRILPAEEWDSVRRYDRTPNGNIIRQNPLWDPDELVVDRTVNMGPGFTRQQNLNWARRNITDEANPRNWVGNIVFNGGGVIVGEHNPGEPLTAGDIQDARVLRPGMNLWLPTWDGGTLVHISAVSLDGGPVVVDVDTRARDALQVWEVQARNRESRQNPARAFELNHRSSMMPKDAIIEFDENGGTLDRSLTWMQQGWNHFPVVAGQEGTVAWLKIHTGAEASDPCEFVCAVTQQEVTDEKWAALIGDPLTPVGYKRWVNEDVRAQLDDRYVLLYTAGSDENPCGYFPSKKVGDDGVATGDPLTGRWEDAASWSYRTAREPVLWVSVYVKHATRLRDGRIFKNQGEAGS